MYYKYKNINRKDLPKNFSRTIFIYMNGVIIKVLYNNSKIFELIYEKFRIVL